MKKNKGIHSLLGVQAKKREIAEQWLSTGRCQVRDCKNPAVKIMEFASGMILCVCEAHRKLAE